MIAPNETCSPNSQSFSNIIAFASQFNPSHRSCRVAHCQLEFVGPLKFKDHRLNFRRVPVALLVWLGQRDNSHD